MFIAFEGPDGCGKSTQTAQLEAFAQKRGVPVAVFRDPGGTPFSDEIRKLVLSFTPASQESLMLAFLAARTELWQRHIRPMSETALVICDRWNLSTLVYQGFSGDLPTWVVSKCVGNMSEWLQWDPALTVVFDCKFETLNNRRAPDNDRFEVANERRRVQRIGAYSQLALHRPGCVAVNGDGTVEEVLGRTLIAIRPVVEPVYPQLYAA